MPLPARARVVALGVVITSGERHEPGDTWTCPLAEAEALGRSVVILERLAPEPDPPPPAQRMQRPAFDRMYRGGGR